ncbi:hypothetical protein EYF80_045841 [Liparis tanakae]|uniref:Uncharacterized protein n=1 Tax=Liparis tanakae TaxID=230148 RepID=A0A4Z2FRT9_9TELE|nr:hypothetical protein EYF80_045841 [Liparis tanakae]
MSPPPLSWWRLLVLTLVVRIGMLTGGGARAAEEVRSSSESLLELSPLLEDEELLESEELSPLLSWSMTRASAISSAQRLLITDTVPGAEQDFSRSLTTPLTEKMDVVALDRAAFPGPGWIASRILRAEMPLGKQPAQQAVFIQQDAMTHSTKQLERTALRGMLLQEAPEERQARPPHFLPDGRPAPEEPRRTTRTLILSDMPDLSWATRPAHRAECTARLKRPRRRPQLQPVENREKSQDSSFPGRWHVHFFCPGLQSHGCSKRIFLTKCLPKVVPPVFWMCRNTITSSPLMLNSTCRSRSLSVKLNCDACFGGLSSSRSWSR